MEISLLSNIYLDGLVLIMNGLQCEGKRVSYVCAALAGA